MNPFKALRRAHGTAFDFGQFDSRRIGTGEGRADEGHGLYFSGGPRMFDRAERYRDFVVNNRHPELAPGRVYEVDINAAPDQFIDLTAPMGAQPSHVQNFFRQRLPDMARADDLGAQINDMYASLPGDVQAWSAIDGNRLGDLLNQRRGLDLPSGGSTRNYVQHLGTNTGGDPAVVGAREAIPTSRGVDDITVVFPGHENLIDIVRKYGLAGLAGGGALAAGMGAGTGDAEAREAQAMEAFVGNSEPAIPGISALATQDLGTYGGLTPYDQTLADRVGGFATDLGMDPSWADYLFGSSGAGYAGMGVADFSPLGAAYAVDDFLRADPMTGEQPLAAIGFLPVGGRALGKAVGAAL